MTPACSEGYILVQPGLKIWTELRLSLHPRDQVFILVFVRYIIFRAEQKQVRQLDSDEYSS